MRFSQAAVRDNLETHSRLQTVFNTDRGYNSVQSPKEGITQAGQHRQAQSNEGNTQAGQHRQAKSKVGNTQAGQHRQTKSK